VTYSPHILITYCSQFSGIYSPVAYASDLEMTIPSTGEKEISLMTRVSEWLELNLTDYKYNICLYSDFVYQSLFISSSTFTSFAAIRFIAELLLINLIILHFSLFPSALHMPRSFTKFHVLPQPPEHLQGTHFANLFRISRRLRSTPLSPFSIIGRSY